MVCLAFFSGSPFCFHISPAFARKEILVFFVHFNYSCSFYEFMFLQVFVSLDLSFDIKPKIFFFSSDQKNSTKRAMWFAAISKLRIKAELVFLVARGLNNGELRVFETKVLYAGIFGQNIYRFSGIYRFNLKNVEIS